MSDNGKLLPSELAPIAQGELAIANYCAASWNAMNVEARALGCELLPTGSRSSYRTYEEQEALYQDYLNGTGNLAAVPGTSNHGEGLAVDVATQDMRSMIDHIGKPYGWSKETSDAPSEWWHLKYLSGVWSGNDPGPYGSPLTEEDVMDICCGVADNGNFHVFLVDKEGDIWFTWQGKGKANWQGGQTGKSIAAFSFFAPAPK
jgi:hypothetical protein